MLRKQIKDAKDPRRKTFREYLDERREMILLNCAINMKKDETENMKRRLDREWVNFREDERKLKCNELKFEEKMKASEMKTIEAVINSEVRTRERMEKAEEVRLLKSKILHVQAEISRNDVKLYDYRGYQRFLETLVTMKEGESSLTKRDDLKQPKGNNMDVAEER
nr:hypothetical transcript [Hymenolepis microstoma]